MKKNRRRPLRRTTKAALVLCAFSLLLLTAWRDVGIHFAYRQGHTVTVSAECTAVSLDRTNEPRRYSAFYLYTFHLKGGETIAIYSDTADAMFSFSDAAERIHALEQQFVTGRPIDFTYVTQPTLVGDTHALVSAADGEAVLLAPKLTMEHFSRRARTLATIAAILYAAALLLLAAPLVPYLHKKYNHHRNRLHKQSKSKSAMKSQIPPLRTKNHKKSKHFP